MTDTWSPDELQHFGQADRRDTGWFGRAVRWRRARARVPGVEADVLIDDLDTATAELRESVDAAYRSKYGPGSSSMVTDDAAATTLRLSRA